MKNRKNMISFFYILFLFSVLGALLSAHLLIVDPLQPFGNLKISDYDNELLDLAHDLASRLLPAFENTPHGLPYPRVSDIYRNIFYEILMIF
jgi:hypothetical protein